MFNLIIQPDLQTRESVMVAGGRVQLSLVDTDGNTRYIKIECKAKQDGRYVPMPLELATHVFVSEKGYGTQRLGTYYPPKPGSKFKTGRFFVDDNLPGGESNGHIVALKAAVEFVNGGQLPPTFTQIEAESKCCLCGHKLEDPTSIERGIGPECAQKPTGTRILHASAFKPTKADEAQLLKDEIHRVRAEIDALTEQRKALCEQHATLVAQFEAMAEYEQEALAV